MKKEQTIDWNRMALEALAKMAFKEPKKTPSEEMQDELEPI